MRHVHLTWSETITNELKAGYRYELENTFLGPEQATMRWEAWVFAKRVTPKGRRSSRVLITVTGPTKKECNRNVGLLARKRGVSIKEPTT